VSTGWLLQSGGRVRLPNEIIGIFAAPSKRHQGVLGKENKKATAPWAYNKIGSIKADSRSCFCNKPVHSAENISTSYKIKRQSRRGYSIFRHPIVKFQSENSEYK
jgi:hypothetical protein